MSNVHYLRAKSDLLTQHFVRKRCPNALDIEIEHLIAKCRELGLDPTSDQTYLLITDPDDREKRRARFMLGINGFRTVADRTGNYRGDGEEPVIETDRALISPTNPKGIVKITARVFVHSHGGWHAVSGTAFWDEYAPVTPGPLGGFLASAWASKPVILLASVAEALAFRKAFPAQFSTVYAPQEFDAAMMGRKTPDAEPAPPVVVQETAKAIPDEVEALWAQNPMRAAKPSSARALEVDWLGWGMEWVPLGIFEDKVIAFVNFWGSDLSIVKCFLERNKRVLVEYFDHDPRSQVEIRKFISVRTNSAA